MKRSRYVELVAERKKCSACEGLVNPSNSSSFDSAEIGPWTRLHGDLGARLMIVGQDWGDVTYFETNRGLDDLNNPTMKALEGLLADIGVFASMSQYEVAASGVFLTNAVLCLKSGGLQAKVSKTWFTNCAQRFLRRQVEIVRPKVVVPLGVRAYTALCYSFALQALPLREVIELPGVALFPGITMVPVYHCGKRVQNTHRPLSVQRQDWQRVRAALADA